MSDVLTSIGQSDQKKLNKTKKCPKYYRRNENTGNCDYQDKNLFNA